MTLSDIFKTLTVEQKAVLMYGFEFDEMKFVNLPEDRFFGVNVTLNNPVFQVEQTEGNWSYGTLKT